MPRTSPGSIPLGRVLILVLVAVLLGVGAAAFLLATVARTWAAIQAPGPAEPADGLLLCVAAAGALLLLWLVLGLALSLLSAAPGATGALAGRSAARLAPATVRTLATVLLTAGLGATLTAGTATAGAVSASVSPAADRAPAAAAPGAPTADVPSAAWPASGSPDGPASGGAPDTAPDAAWTPPEPPRGPVPDPDALDLLSRAPAAGGMVDEDVVVRRGDTLWSIAGRHLGPSATADEIAREWPRWHDANRDAIGNDPDLIQPGQVLHPPAPRTGAP